MKIPLLNFFTKFNGGLMQKSGKNWIKLFTDSCLRGMMVKYGENINCFFSHE